MENTLKLQPRDYEVAQLVLWLAELHDDDVELDIPTLREIVDGLHRLNKTLSELSLAESATQADDPPTRSSASEEKWWRNHAGIIQGLKGWVSEEAKDQSEGEPQALALALTGELLEFLDSGAIFCRILDRQGLGTGSSADAHQHAVDSIEILGAGDLSAALSLLTRAKETLCAHSRVSLDVSSRLNFAEQLLNEAFDEAEIWDDDEE